MQAIQVEIIYLEREGGADELREAARLRNKLESLKRNDNTDWS